MVEAPVSKNTGGGGNADRRLWESLASLYSVHAFNYLVPLFTLPYLARVLGVAAWGAYAFADAYGRVVLIAVEYGFGLSATREVARVRHDPGARSRELAGVLGAQLLLGFFAVLITLVLATAVPVFAAHRRLLPGALFLAMSQGASPMWYFQAIERVKVMGALWIAARIAGAAGLFLFVRGPGDGWLALFIQGTAPFLSVAVGLALAYRDTPFLWPSLRLGWRALHSGGTLFLYRAGVSLYTSMNVLLLGLLAPPVVVAFYAGAEKIARAAVQGTGPITQVFFPRISHLMVHDRPGAARAARMSVLLMTGVGLGAGCLLFFGAPVLVRLLLGAGFEGAVPVLRILALLPPLIALSTAFGSQWMLALGMERELGRITLAAGVVNLALSLALGAWLQHIGVAAAIVLVEVFVTCAMVATLRRWSLGPWNEVVEEVAA
jgi:polysaccharide transporter, PST family